MYNMNDIESDITYYFEYLMTFYLNLYRLTTITTIVIIYLITITKKRCIEAKKLQLQLKNKKQFQIHFH